MLLLWCLSMIQVFSYPLGERSFHFFVDLKQAIVFVSGKKFHLMFWDVSISPRGSYPFVVGFFQQLRYNLLGRMLSKLICGRSCHFLLRYLIPTIYLLLFISSGGIVMLLSSLIFSVCEDRVLFVLILFQPECGLKSFFSLVPFFH